MRSRSLLAATATALVATAGCGTAVRSSAPTAGQITRSLRRSPPPLAAIHAQADVLLAGGPAAFAARLRALRGFPVVVNKWASWCGPCQTEFPAFQRVSVSLGRRVAFLGIDGEDHDPAAEAFLRRFPVTYPSYVDPQEQIARSIKAATYYPQTVLFDRTGRLVLDHAGPYLTPQQLEHDIRAYLLSGR